MSDSAEHQSSWVYAGVWGLMTGLFCVPRTAPTLPVMQGEQIVARKPSPGYINYRKLQFAILAMIIFIAILVLIAVAAIIGDAVPLVIAALIVIVFVPICLLAYLAIYLRYDTMWYVFSDRSMRLRRGIWVINESTITFENIQNVKVSQGPVQRMFGIANVVVETAGGGSAQGDPSGGLGMHAGLIEGVAEAAEIRDSIMQRVRTANTTGLGDEAISEPTPKWSAQHLAVLREIRDLAELAAKSER